MAESNGGEHSGQDQQSADSESLPPGGPPHRPNTERADPKPDPPNWVEKWTFIILVATFGAALLAGVEAWRLADLTQDAITDARNGAADTHADTIRAENLTADALGQAQSIANSAHQDNSLANITARNAIAAGQRAWISPRNIAFKVPFAVGQPVKLTINYDNIGHTPAADVAAKFEIQKVSSPTYIPDLPRLRRAIGRNETCEKISPVPGADTVYPSSAFSPAYSWDFDPSDFVGDEKIQTGEVFLVAKGCFKYRTANSVHMTAFCEMLRADKGVKAIGTQWALCPIGNEGD